MFMKTVVILQSNYIPWKGYFDLIHDADVFVYYDDVQYTKNDWRNRNKICTREGMSWLTIPIPKKSVHLPISQVVIEQSQWQQEHFKTLYYTYKSSPYFDQLLPLMEECYHKVQWQKLIDINRFAIEQIAQMLGIQTHFMDVKDFTLEGNRVERLISLLKQLGATRYISGPSAKNYLQDSEHLFVEHSIELVYKSYHGYPQYPQLQELFTNEVSILDMIAHLPLHSIPEYIWQWRNNQGGTISDS
jgi:WbqC-like protein family